MRACSRNAVFLVLAALLLPFAAAAPSEEPHNKTNRIFDLIVRSEITIDRPAKEVWLHVIEMEAWMADNRFQNIEGRRGEEGEVRRVTPRADSPYGGYFITTVRATPFEQYVVKVVPEKGDDYFGFADFSFTEVDGRTHLLYDIYIELKVSGMSEAEFRQFGQQQYAEGRPVVDRNLRNLKALVEAQR